MINNDQYNLLKKFSNFRLDVESSVYDNETLNDLLISKLIEISNYIPHSTYNQITEYQITAKGKSAIEEYERMLSDIKNQKETLRIAQESNNIAVEANKKSKNSNIISWVAVVVSIVAVIIDFFH